MTATIWRKLINENQEKKCVIPWRNAAPRVPIILRKQFRIARAAFDIFTRNLWGTILTKWKSEITSSVIILRNNCDFQIRKCHKSLIFRRRMRYFRTTLSLVGFWWILSIKRFRAARAAFTISSHNRNEHDNFEKRATNACSQTFAWKRFSQNEKIGFTKL